MPTYDDAAGYRIGTQGAHPALGVPKTTVASVDLDFAKITSARENKKLTALKEADTLDVIRVPANTLILAVVAQVVKAESEAGAKTIDVGFAEAANSVAAEPARFVTALNYKTGKAEHIPAKELYTDVDNTINVLLKKGFPKDAIIRISAIMVDLS